MFCPLTRLPLAECDGMIQAIMNAMNATIYLYIYTPTNQLFLQAHIALLGKVYCTRLSGPPVHIHNARAEGGAVKTKETARAYAIITAITTRCP